MKLQSPFDIDTRFLTSLRFFAAFVVVAFHFGRQTTVNDFVPGLLRSGNHMVCFFFVLSGFVLAFSEFRKKERSYLRFMAERASRILPLYFLAGALSVYLLQRKFQTGDLGLVDLGLLFSLLQSWFPGYALTINAPAWSLSVEMFLYMTFPFIFAAITRSKNPVLFSIGLASGLYVLTQTVIIYSMNAAWPLDKFETQFFVYFPIQHLCSFVFGIMGGFIAQSADTHKIQLGTISTNIASVLTFAAIAYVLLEHPFTRFGKTRLPENVSLLAPLFVLLMLTSLHKLTLVNFLFRSKPLVFLGEISFGIYILQQPIFRFVNRYILSNQNVDPDLFFLVYALILIAVSWLSFLFFETPLRKWILGHYKPIHYLRNVGNRMRGNGEEVKKEGSV